MSDLDFRFNESRSDTASLELRDLFPRGIPSIAPQARAWALLGVLCLPALAARAAEPEQHSRFEAWNALSEDDLHTKTFSTYGGTPEDIFAPCDPSGKLQLPAPYLRDYKLAARDLAALQRTLDAAKRFADIDDAFASGYLPSKQGFIQSVGLLMIQPDGLRDGAFSFDKPDILAYVRKPDADEYRLVGLAYVAGTVRPVPLHWGFLDSTGRPDENARPKAATWGYDENVCVMVEPESVAIYYGKEAPNGCKDGVLFDRMYRLYAWTPVYNPLGLFADKNTIVDWLDHTQKYPPLCPKKAKIPVKPKKQEKQTESNAEEAEHP